MNNENTGLTRGKDGILVWTGGIGARYRDPGEAIKCHNAGRLELACAEQALGTFFHRHPCGKRAKHDPDMNGNPTRCGNHSKEAYARRAAKKEETDARWRAQWRATGEVSDANKAVEEALRKIAAGDNDPRTLAIDTIHRLDKARAAHKAAHARETKP